MDKYLEFRIKFEPYHGHAVVSLYEITKTKDMKFARSDLVVLELFKMMGWFGVPKTESQIKAGINKLKIKVLTQYLRNQRMTAHLEKFIYDETEGKYYLRHSATESFIERLRGK